MPRILLAALALTLAAPSLAAAKPLTVAVIGDIPYGSAAVAAFPGDIDQINADPAVRRVIHLGDIKNGSSPCDTSYFELIRSDFDRFDDPLVYTPGDNEWTDCHRANNGGYVPTERLAEVRRIFFDEPGRTLGDRRPVRAQSTAFPENVRWNEKGVVWATFNVPGSNNDLLPWFGSAETPEQQTLQADEVATRDAADVAWLDRTFDEAAAGDAAAVVVALQADMWDPAITGDPAQYSGFTRFVRELADRSRAFPGPVLLLNGDSHVYESDRPLADPDATNSRIYGVDRAVPNLLRVTVDGSNNANDYLRLHVEPGRPGVFSWERVPYAP
ncbi:MAG: hypothetical protein JWM73_1439 [Solirubrobacterales bacterium]|nr:hypothetical protein [Solirubrobacterales bacterium]